MSFIIGYTWSDTGYLYDMHYINEYHVPWVPCKSSDYDYAWSRIHSQQWLLWLGEHLGPAWRRSRALARSVLTTLQSCDTNTAQHKRQGERLKVSESYEVQK